MNRLIQLLESLPIGPHDPNGKSPVRHVGAISCANVTRILHVPFYEPCVIAVLSGRKLISDQDGATVCEMGEIVTIPAPASFDLRNEPDAGQRKYRALIIPFSQNDLERLRQIHGFSPGPEFGPPRPLKFRCDEILCQALEHYLRSPEDPNILGHRLMEILLLLAGQDKRLLNYPYAVTSWISRVRSVVSSDLARDWVLADVCEQLMTSDSTLRRNLRREGFGFRELLYDLRLNAALMLLLQTSLPIYRIAYDCGYQSISRFSSNFRQRFGLPPTEFRALNGGGHELAVRGQPR